MSQQSFLDPNGFIVKNNERNVAHDWMEPDNEAWYDRITERFGIAWNYANTKSKLTYTYNSDGFRDDKLLQDIQYEPYIVTLGSSPIEGGGVAYEDTFQQKLQRTINTPVYNMGVAGFSNLEQMHNFVNLVTNYNAPKAVIMQSVLPQLFSVPDPSEKDKMVTVGPWTLAYREGIERTRGKEWADNAIQSLHLREATGVDELEQHIYFKLAENICRDKGIQLIILEISSPDPMKDKVNCDWLNISGPYDRDMEVFKQQFLKSVFYSDDEEENILFNVNKYARDLFHAGDWWHTEAADKLSQVIK